MRRNQLRPTLNVNLSQRLAITPSLLQKIELLTLNRLELSEMLNQELAENPVLEEVAEISDGDEPQGGRDREAERGESSNKAEDFDYEYFFGEYLNSSGYQRSRVEADDDRPTFDLFLASPTSLYDHLTWQLNLTPEISPDTIRIIDFLIGNINEDGYLTISDEDAARTLGVTGDTVREAVTVLQGFDPVGIGARDLRECLLLQLQASDSVDSLAYRIVSDFLPLIQQKKYKEAARELNSSLSDISEALETIRKLSPRPGQKFNSREPVYVQPDVYIFKVGDEYQISLNDDGMPKLRLNREYRKLLKQNGVSKETKSYIKERFRSAVELLKSVDQRHQTIYRVAKAIVERQPQFLDRGLMHLRPMLIKDLAEELGVHSSTISRVVANKYAHTPQGVMELRKFFTVGVESSAGENVSIVLVKEKIRQIVDNEDSKRPLSDQKICRILNQQGIQITRRTVAKYRDQMNIAGSRERKMALLI